jgi:hypothetical protein
VVVEETFMELVEDIGADTLENVAMREFGPEW